MEPSATGPARRARVAVTVVFVINGALFGSLVARMPDIRDHAGLSHGGLGVALACVAAGAIVAMPAAGLLAARHGSRTPTRTALGLACGAVVLPTLATSLPALCGAFLVHGVAMGALDVTMNSQGVEIERRLPRPILSGLHAGFSLGGLAGAGLAAAAAAAGVDVRDQVVALSVVAAVVGLAWSRRLLPAHADAAGHGEPMLARPPRRLWALGALAFSGLLIEGAAADWSAVYLRDELDAGADTAALTFVAFSITMVAGRLVGDRVVTRIGPEAVVRAGGVLAGGGFGLALLVDRTSAAFAGFACLGAGMAVLVPVVFRAAGATAGIAPGVALAAVSSMGYLGFVAGPPLIGAIASVTSLPAGLGVLVALGAAVVLLAPSARGDRRRPAGRSAAAAGTVARGHGS